MTGFCKYLRSFRFTLWSLFCLLAYVGAFWLYRATDVPLLMSMVAVSSLLLFLPVVLSDWKMLCLTWCDILLLSGLMFIGIRRALQCEPLPFGRCAAWISCVSVYAFLRTSANNRADLQCVSIWLLRCLSFVEAVVVMLQQTGLLQSRYAYSAVSGTFDNPAFSACFMALGAVAWLERLHRSAPWWRTFVASLCLVALCVALLLTDSRAAWAAAASGSFVVLYSRLSPSWRRWLVAAGLVVLVLGGGVLYLYKRPSADGRLLIWYNTLIATGEHPLFGYGPDAFVRHYAAFQADYFQAHPDSRFAMVAGNPSTPFSEPLRVAFSYGLTGLLLAVVAWSMVWRRSSLHLRALLLTWSIFSLFSYPLSVFRTAVMLLVLLGFHSDRPVFSVAVQSSRWRIGFAVLLLVSLCALCMALPRWQTVTRQALSGMPMPEKVYAKMKYDEPLFLLSYQMADDTLRYRMLDDAMVLYPSEQIWCDYADRCAAEGDTAAAEWWYERAALCVPSLLTPPYRLLELAESSGDTLAVLRAASRVIEHPVKVENTRTIRMRARARTVLERWEKQDATIPLTTTPDNRFRR